MSAVNFEKNYAQVWTAIDACLKGRLHIPAMILMYSTIDTLAWVAADKKANNVRARFEGWVNRWLLPNSTLKCSATDLYAARCGILHTLTYEAELTKSGRAKRLMYAWGTASVESQRQSIARMGQAATHEAVHLDELYKALRAAFTAFLGDAKADPGMKQRLEEASRLHFDEMDTQSVAAFLDLTNPTVG